MLPRERVAAALAFGTPDVIPLRIYAAPGGLYEHGQKLVDLTVACGHDFGDLSGLALPAPPPAEDYDAQGRYHAFRTDDWGIGWEYLIYGIWGHPVHWPLDDLAALEHWRPPAPPAATGAGVEAARQAVAQTRRTWFTLGGGGSLFERLHSVRRFEQVLMDIALDTPEINRLEDLLLEHARGCVAYSIAVDFDAISFGDDFGTQEALLCSPQTWQRFFKPRYRELFEPIRASGKPIFFHVCGQVDALLEQFAELGVKAIWPQLTAFKVPDLARRCRDLGLAVELHPDRGDLMQRAKPSEVRDYVLRLLDDFDSASGGSWLYLEIDPGFPWENVEALFAVAMEVRGQS